MTLFEEAKSFQGDLIELRRFFHAHPETDYALPVTRQHIQEELDRLGVPYQYVKNAGFIATLGKAGGKTILLRADMDALPIQEDTGLPFASVHAGKMHACGHDLHTTMLLGAARLLKAHENELPGKVFLLFQEAEESFGGALNAINSPVLNPLPDHAFSMHVFPSDTYETGTFRCTRGVLMSSVDRLEVSVKGVASHGSAPQNGVNAIVAATKLIGAFTDLMRYELDPQLPAVLTVCEIHGGKANNIIPETCTFGGTLRMIDEEKRAYVLKRLREIADGVEAAYRVRVEVTAAGIPATYNDPAFTQNVHDWIEALEGERIEAVGTKLNMVSEDFAEFGQRVPSCMLELMSRSPEGRHFPGHNPCVIFDEEVLYRGSAAYAQVAIAYLNS